jgi:hypothetical protein
VFKVLEWVGMDGEAQAEEAPAIEAPVEAEAAAPARRRRG